MDNYSLYAQEEGFEFSLDKTENGYLITWGDYVINSEAKGFLSLSQAFSFLALIAADAQEGERKHLFNYWQKLIKESEAN